MDATAGRRCCCRSGEGAYGGTPHAVVNVNFLRYVRTSASCRNPEFPEVAFFDPNVFVRSSAANYKSFRAEVGYQNKVAIVPARIGLGGDHESTKTPH